jgi:Methyltransferase domain
LRRSTVSDLVLKELRDRAEFEAAAPRVRDCVAYENLLQQAYANIESWQLPAICQACGNAVGLLADKHHSFDGRVNFRERLICPVCHLNTRQRFMAQRLRQVVSQFDRRPVVYLYEQVTPFFHWARTALEADVLGSEYLGHGLEGGTIVNGVRHEDALALSFADASLDVIVSQDVLEHVPEIEPAIAEAARVLRPGGRFMFSVPLDVTADVTVKRAELRDGAVVNLMEPVFHGNPVSAEGSLVFYDHGWDLLENLRAGGFSDVSMVGAWSALYGYLSAGLLPIYTATRV